ncbi:hypothetical protein OF83DRAFT_1176281 [Amylostereum chailletii]|nr:hypothetical protein OF83DRAFT_1176281 [Amylostereum chailletii]
MPPKKLPLNEDSDDSQYVEDTLEGPVEDDSIQEMEEDWANEFLGEFRDLPYNKRLRWWREHIGLFWSTVHHGTNYDPMYLPTRKAQRLFWERCTVVKWWLFEHGRVQREREWVKFATKFHFHDIVQKLYKEEIEEDAVRRVESMTKDERAKYKNPIIKVYQTSVKHITSNLTQGQRKEVERTLEEYNHGEVPNDVREKLAKKKLSGWALSFAEAAHKLCRVPIISFAWIPSPGGGFEIDIIEHGKFLGYAPKLFTEYFPDLKQRRLGPMLNKWGTITRGQPGAAQSRQFTKLGKENAVKPVILVKDGVAQLPTGWTIEKPILKSKRAFWRAFFTMEWNLGKDGSGAIPWGLVNSVPTSFYPADRMPPTWIRPGLGDPGQYNREEVNALLEYFEQNILKFSHAFWFDFIQDGTERKAATKITDRSWEPNVQLDADTSDSSDSEDLSNRKKPQALDTSDSDHPLASRLPKSKKLHKPAKVPPPTPALFLDNRSSSSSSPPPSRISMVHDSSMEPVAVTSPMREIADGSDDPIYAIAKKGMHLAREDSEEEEQKLTIWDIRPIHDAWPGMPPARVPSRNPPLRVKWLKSLYTIK